MKTLVIIFSALCLIHACLAWPDYSAGNCAFDDKHGGIHFREAEGKLQAHIYMHKLPTASSRYHIHVHENEQAHDEPPCSGIGPHFDPAIDAGNIEPDGGLFSNAMKHIHVGPYTVKHLSLSGATTGIIGRSVAIHNSSGKKIFCCDIVDAVYDPSHF